MRPLTAVILALLATSLGAAAPVPDDEVEKPARELFPQLRAQLRSPVKFGGFEKDKRMTFKDALDMLEELYDLPFVVNEEAFKAENLNDVLRTKPVDKVPLPRMFYCSLETVLRRLLTRVPSTSGATYVLRPGHIEITTVQALRKELRIDANAPLLPLVQMDLDRLLLSEALPLLAGQTGWNVVIDPRVGDKAKTAVTAFLSNVPIDTAVRLLADMAGLKSIAIDNVLYVTTPENAKTLQAEQEERRLKQSRNEKSDAPAPK